MEKEKEKKHQTKKEIFWWKIREKSYFDLNGSFMENLLLMLLWLCSMDCKIEKKTSKWMDLDT